MVYQRRKNGIRLAEGHWQQFPAGPGIFEFSRQRRTMRSEFEYAALKFWVYPPEGSPKFPLPELYEPVLVQINREGVLHFRGFQGPYVQEWICKPVSLAEYREGQRQLEEQERIRKEMATPRRPTETRHPVPPE